MRLKHFRHLTWSLIDVNSIILLRSPSAFASPISISAESCEASAACFVMEAMLIWPGIFALGGGYGEGGAWDDIGHPFWSKIFGDMAGLLRAWSFELARSRPHLRHVLRSRRRQPREREWSNTIQDHVENGGGDGGGHLLYYFESLKIFGFIYLNYLFIWGENRFVTCSNWRGF